MGIAVLEDYELLYQAGESIRHRDCHRSENVRFLVIANKGFQGDVNAGSGGKRNGNRLQAGIGVHIPGLVF